MKQLGGLLLAASVALVAPGARAEYLAEAGLGARANAMAGALTAEANDFSASYYNPALLVHATKTSFAAAFNWQKMAASVESTVAGKSLDCTYCTSPDAAGLSAGFVFPLGGKVENHLALGLAAYLPVSKLVRVLAPDPGRPFWLQHQSAPERLGLFISAGARLTDWLTLGVGLHVLADLVGSGATIKVDLVSKRVQMAEVDSSLATRAAPVFGVHLKPYPWLKLGVSYRWEMALGYGVPAAVDIDGLGRLAFTVSGITHFIPHTVSFGASVDVLPELTLALDGQYAMWSLAPTPYTDLIIDLSGDTLKALGIDEALDIASPKHTPKFSDILSVRLGAEWRPAPRFTLRGGFSYRPTMVPRQDAEGTNILDATTLTASLGGAVHFDDPLEIFASPLSLELGLRGTFLLPRDAKKDPLDTVPAYKYSAFVFGLSAGLRYDF